MLENEEEKHVSIEEALGEAWDAAESEEPAVEEPLQDSSDESEGWEADSGNEPDGSEPVRAERGEEPVQGAPDESDPLDEPPRGLSATAREAWKETPKAIREAIHKRSEDYSNGIQKYAQDAKIGETFKQTVQPYQQLFAMNNVSPPQLVGQLLQTASVLQMGSPQQKASLVANMINQFGVDIRELDGLLSGEGFSEEMNQQSQLDQMLNQRLAPLQQQLQQYQQREMQAQQQSQQQVQSELQAFASNPANRFYQDVRNQMADVLDEAAHYGRDMTLQQAYEEACWRNPEIRQLKMREQQSQVAQRKRQSSSSVYGTPASANGAGGTKNLRDTIAAAFESQGRV